MLEQTLKNYNFEPVCSINSQDENNALSFFENLEGSEHILNLYRTVAFRNRLQKQFLTSNIELDFPRIFFSHKSVHMPKVSNIVYSGFLEDSKENLNKSWNTTIENIHSTNNTKYPTRLADEECSWWLNNGYLTETLEYEKSSGDKIESDMIALCSYDIVVTQKLESNVLEELLKTHKYVISEDLLSIYKKYLVCIHCN